MRELLAPLRPWRRAFALALAAQIISMTFGLTFPWLIGRLVDAALPSIKPAPQEWHLSLNTAALLLTGTLAAQAVLTFFSSATFNSVGQRAVTAPRLNLYERLIGLPMKFHGEHRVGELASRLGND